MFVSTLSVDVVREIASYLDMSALRKMINLSDKMEPSVRDVLSLEFYRRGEKFVNWVNSLRVVREVTERKITETTHYSDKSRLVIQYDPVGELMIYRIDILVNSSRVWSGEGVFKSLHVVDNQGNNYCEQWNDHWVRKVSFNYRDHKRHGLYQQWNDRGMKIVSENYKNGKPHGLCEEWNDEGELIFTKYYKDGPLWCPCEQGVIVRR